MTYSTCAMLAGLIPNLINGASNLDNFTADITPASSAMRQFMSGGCSLIQAKINSMGYVAPGSGGLLGDFFASVEANYAAWQSELARSSPRVAKGERSRADDFRKAYEAGLRSLEKMDLSMIGFTMLQATGSGWYSGGTSVSDKQAVESDTDRVDPRIARGQFDDPSLPGAETGGGTDKQER